MSWRSKNVIDQTLDKIQNDIARLTRRDEASLNDFGNLADRVRRIEERLSDQKDLDEARADTLRTMAREYLEGSYVWGLGAVIERLDELDPGYEARVEAWDNKASAGGKIVRKFLVRREPDSKWTVFEDAGNTSYWPGIIFGPHDSVLAAAEAMMQRGGATHLRFDDTTTRRFAPAEENDE